MNSKTLLSLAGIVLAVGAALYNWKYGTPSTETPVPGGNSSTGTATQEPRPSDSKAPEGATNASQLPAKKAVTPEPPAKSNTASNPAPKAPEKPTPADVKQSAPTVTTSTVGFGSTRSFDDHYEKHGAEFGSISQAEYLAMAQKLRDAPVGGSILEAVRDDGVISRFDKKTGAFLAFNKNKTIRTFFKPNDGVRYFERQIEKEH